MDELDNLSGSISVPETQRKANQNESNLNTLDEPFTETLMRDLRLIGIKLKHVLLVGETEEDTLRELRDWDLWGPLLVCLTLSIMLSFTAPEGQTALVFSAVFVVVSVGAAIVTLNAQLLGGTISFFQSVCVLGYCVFPMNVVALLCILIKSLFSHTVILRLLCVCGGFVWATRASVVFMSQMVPPNRKVLAVYPVLLFYIFIGWLILIQ